MEVLDTQKKKKEVSRFIILIPHRDVFKTFKEYRKMLLTSGFHGAWSFPILAPLVSVSGPFTKEELKALGQNIRDLTMETGRKIHSENVIITHNSEKLSFFGPILGPPIAESIFPESAKVKILHSFFPPALCAALLAPPDEKPEPGNHNSVKAPVLSFRAAALANLAIRPLAGGDLDYSFEWRISQPVWLPGRK